MSWKFVFQCKIGSVRDVHEAVDLAIRFGYDFLLWNGRVLHVASGIHLETKIKTEDLF